VGDVTTAVTKQAPVLGQQPDLCQAEEGGQHQAVGQVPGAAKEDDTVDLALCAVPLSRALPAAARLSKPAGLDNKAAVSGQRRPRICIPVYQVWH
jgi:hypothetical protein